MSVSLKLKNLAVCSFYEITKKATGMCVPVYGTPWFAKHCSSCVLRLPGEEETEEITKKRTAIVQERINLKVKLRKLSRVLSLAGKEKKETREEFIKIFKRADFCDESLLVDNIAAHLEDAQPDWQNYILSVHRDLEHDLGKEFECWRKKYRRKSMELRNICGLSLWWVQELTETRKLINSWCAHARLPREIVRARSLRGERKDKRAREVDLDNRLLQHINHVKEDRIKKGADMIVMAALGYRYNSTKNKWIADHAPCRIILFQDISDFRMDRSQSRRDNARLMVWSHRAIPKHVANQGEIYGLHTGIVRASNLGQWHARSGSPALRMLRVKDEYLDQSWFLRGLMIEMTKRKQISKKDRKTILDLTKTEQKKRLQTIVQEGQWIPWDLGATLVTLINNKPSKGYYLVNQTQMLQRLFWTRQLQITKLWCVGTDARGWAPVRVGKRVEASLGYGILVAAENESFVWESITKRQHSALVGKVTDEFSGEEGAIDNETEPDDGKTNQMFFRDPSGVFFPVNRWYKTEKFWREIEKTLDATLNASKMHE